MADDAKREAAARKITEGEYRHKRRGKDFWSDDEDGSPRKKRWSKKERRARREWKEDGLEKLGTFSLSPLIMASSEQRTDPVRWRTKCVP